MIAAEKISHLCYEIERKTDELCEVKNKLGVLLRSSNELDNVYRGFLSMKENGRDGSCPGFEGKFVAAKAAAVEALNLYSAMNERDRALRDQIAALEADVAGCSTEAKVAYSRTVYSEQHAKLVELVAQGEALDGEDKASQQALKDAQLTLTGVQAKKRQALCVADVAVATKAETAAQSRIDDLLTLIGNIKAEKEKLDAERERMSKGLAQAEAALWSEGVTLMLEALRRSAEFEGVADALRRVCIAQRMGGQGFNINAFLTQAFSEWKESVLAGEELNASIGEELAAEFGVQLQVHQA